MREEHERILLECHRREKVHGKDQRPPGWHWARPDFDEQTEYGPRYSCHEWFGPQLERDRMRFQRALHSLAAEGLITLGLVGRRVSRIKLTEAGVLAAKELLAAERRAKRAAKQSAATVVVEEAAQQ